MPGPMRQEVMRTRPERVGADTRLRAAGRRRRWLPLVAAGLAFFYVPALAAEPVSGDSPVALNAKVVWIASDRVVLAANDSLGIEEWDALRFFDGKKSVASG